VTRAMVRPSSHQCGDHTGVYPHIVVVPVGEKEIDAAQIGEVNLSPQFLRDIQTFTGPEQVLDSVSKKKLKMITDSRFTVVHLPSIGQIHGDNRWP